MSWGENLLIILGVSLDLFAAMECQGSLVNKVNKRHLSLICLIVAAWQVVALLFGYYISYIICKKNPISDEALLGEIISIVIFCGLGTGLIIKAVKDEAIVERLELTLGFKRFVRMAAATSIYTVLAGIAFGFLSTTIVPILVMIALITILVIILGMYTGYHFGFEQKTKAYIIGAVILWLAGIDVIVRWIINIA